MSANRSDMGMGKKERKELVSATISQLEEVLPASGKPEELVKLTTAIVQSTKKLLDGHTRRSANQEYVYSFRIRGGCSTHSQGPQVGGRSGETGPVQQS